MQIFMLRSKPHQIERMDVFLEKNICAIGWVATGDLTNVTNEGIREILKSLDYKGQSLSTNFGMVSAFVYKMQKGDIVLIRKGDLVHIGIVEEYKWRKEYKDMYMAHTRSVQWVNQVPFKELNASIQTLLKNIRTIAQYHGTLEESGLSKYISNTPETQPEQKPVNKDKEHLLANTIEILKDLANNAQDEKVRLEATKELLKHLTNI